MTYVDGYVLPVPKKNLKAYAALAKKAAKIWMDHGALSVRECVGEDLNVKCGVRFPKLVKPKAGETVVFSWIEFKSRADRDRVNGKVMKDSRLGTMVDLKKMPFDITRMAYGGFKAIVKE